MSKLYMLSKAQMVRIEPYFPLAHGVPASVIGIIFVIRNGLRWRDAPAEYGPHKPIYNRFIRWSRLGVFNKIFAALAATSDSDETLMIDATHLKAHRTAASLLKKGLFPVLRDNNPPDHHLIRFASQMHRTYQGRLELKTPCCV